MISVLRRGSSPARRAPSALGRILGWDAAYRSRRQLSELTDAQLKDIGVSPSEARGPGAVNWPAPRWMTQPW